MESNRSEIGDHLRKARGSFQKSISTGLPLSCGKIEKSGDLLYDRQDVALISITIILPPKENKTTQYWPYNDHHDGENQRIRPWLLL